MMQTALRSEATATPPRRAADINAYIKVIVEVSRVMNMTATDAMLTAKQADERSRGFTAASSQMRRFNRQLDYSMDEMLRHISRLVLEISALSKDERARQNPAATREMSRANRTLRGLAARRREEGARHAQGGVQEDWAALGHELHHAFLLLQTALGLACGANIESVYGGEMAASLKQAVGEIGATTQRVMAGVRQFSAYADD
ncbi:MAG: hypothetical protein HZA59_14305 [Hydrogenophilales bacterium]|nr:hypothetical protein [Hydrogenophilales bacterium]